jgi:hypothetical protein
VALHKLWVPPLQRSSSKQLLVPLQNRVVWLQELQQQQQQQEASTA